MAGREAMVLEVGRAMKGRKEDGLWRAWRKERKDWCGLPSCFYVRWGLNFSFRPTACPMPDTAGCPTNAVHDALVPQNCPLLCDVPSDKRPVAAELSRYFISQVVH